MPAAARGLTQPPHAEDRVWRSESLGLTARAPSKTRTHVAKFTGNPIGMIGGTLDRWRIKSEDAGVPGSPGTARPALVGIAKMAAASPRLEAKNRADYF